jgi:hypothetical protein
MSQAQKLTHILTTVMGQDQQSGPFRLVMKHYGCQSVMQFARISKAQLQEEYCVGMKLAAGELMDLIDMQEWVKENPLADWNAKTESDFEHYCRKKIIEIEEMKTIMIEESKQDTKKPIKLIVLEDCIAKTTATTEASRIQAATTECWKIKALNDDTVKTVIPTEPSKMIEPTAPIQPINPIKPIKTIESTVPIEPTEPNKMNELPTEKEINETVREASPDGEHQARNGFGPDHLCPTEPMEPNEPTEMTKPNKPNESGKTIKPTEQTDPIEPTKLTEKTKQSMPTVVPTEPNKPTDTTEATKPTKSMEPTKPTEPTEPIAPLEPIELVETTEQTDPTKPTELIKAMSLKSSLKPSNKWHQKHDNDPPQIPDDPGVIPSLDGTNEWTQKRKRNQKTLRNQERKRPKTLDNTSDNDSALMKIYMKGILPTCLLLQHCYCPSGQLPEDDEMVDNQIEDWFKDGSIFQMNEASPDGECQAGNRFGLERPGIGHGFHAGRNVHVTVTGLMTEMPAGQTTQAWGAN